MEIILIIPLLVSFLATLFIMPKWIGKAKTIGLVWEDMNKFERKKETAGSGGLVVMMGFILGVLFYIFIQTFYFRTATNLNEVLSLEIKLFALTTSLLILGSVGLIDDLLGWWHGGLSKRFRLIMFIFATVPLIVINAGSSNISIPFFDGIDLGLLYVLVVIPLGIAGAASSFNFLAGFNGLEAGQGIIIISALSFVTYFAGNSWLALMGLCMVFSLLAFLYFNKFPAKIFPGDSLTYPVGGMIAIMAILGDMEKIAVFFFIPYILEVTLKTRGKLKMHSFGKPNKDNTLEMPYDKIYGLEHLSIWALKKIKKDGKVYEKDVVHLIWGLQILIVLLGLILFSGGILA